MRSQAEARTLPVLIAQDTEDTHCLYETMIGQVKAVYGDVEVQLLEGVGRAPQFERQRETNRHILTYIASVGESS